MNVAPESSNRTEQSAARLPIQTCICAPEQDRLLSLMHESAKKKKKNIDAWMSVKLLKKPPPTMVSHRVKLPDPAGRAEVEEAEEEGVKRGSETDCHHPRPQLQHKILISICTLKSASLCFDV